MKLILVKKVPEASGTKSFHFKPEKEVNWLPGQYYYFTLPKLNYEDLRGSTRHFTISSSPTEKNIVLTTRMRQESGYKKTLDEIKDGEAIEGDGPSGTFILDEEKDEPQVFLAGGIGVTPFRSFLKYSFDKNLKTPFFLIYSNSHTEEIAFKKELEGWVKTNPNFKLLLLVSKPEESKEKWSGTTGRIDGNLIQKALKDWNLDLKNVNFWISGPPAMVSGVEQELWRLNIPSDNIQSEKFTGY